MDRDLVLLRVVRRPLDLRIDLVLRLGTSTRRSMRSRQTLRQSRHALEAPKWSYWAANSNLELCLFPFPGIRFRFPFSPYPPFSLFPGKNSAFFCKIQILPAILCHFQQFRQNSVKFAAKNPWFAKKSAKFCKTPEISKKTWKIAQKIALERCKGLTIL